MRPSRQSLFLTRSTHTPQLKNGTVLYVHFFSGLDYTITISNGRLYAYILKVNKLAESIHQARKIGGKRTKMATTKNRDKNI